MTYALGMDDSGRPQAKSVVFAGERIKAPRRRRRSNVPALFAVCFLLLMAGAYSDGQLPRPIPVWYGILSVVTVFAYGFDKSAALSHSWRTRESTLHFLALLGGWPGAIFAQRVFRHKSSKVSFQSVFWVTVVFNCVALGVLVSPWGAEVVNPVLEDLLRDAERWVRA